MLESAQQRIFDLRADGLPLVSWWDQTGQQVVNGSFLSRERFVEMNTRTPEYVRQHLRRWQNLLNPDADSSSR